MFSPLAVALSSGANNSAVFQVIQSQIVFDNSIIESATIIPPDNLGNYGVDIKLKTMAANKVADVTQDNIGKQTNIIIDKRVVSSSIIRGKLTGNFIIYPLTKKQANQFIKSLSLESQ